MKHTIIACLITALVSSMVTYRVIMHTLTIDIEVRADSSVTATVSVLGSHDEYDIGEAD